MRVEHGCGRTDAVHIRLPAGFAFDDAQDMLRECASAPRGQPPAAQNDNTAPCAGVQGAAGPLSGSSRGVPWISISPGGRVGRTTFRARIEPTVQGGEHNAHTL